MIEKFSQKDYMGGEEATENHRNVAGFKKEINRLPCRSEDFFIPQEQIGTKIIKQKETRNLKVSAQIRK